VGDARRHAACRRGDRLHAGRGRGRRLVLRVTEEIAHHLRIVPGQTDASGTFTLLEVECLGACDRAPVVMVNDGWHECLKPEDAVALLDAVKATGEAGLSGCVHRVEK
jgi:(2Fe-2S) ferredoxin